MSVLWASFEPSSNSDLRWLGASEHFSVYSTTVFPYNLIFSSSLESTLRRVHQALMEYVVV